MSKQMIRNIVLVVLVLSCAALVSRYSKGKLYSISVSHSTNKKDKVLAIHLNSENPNKKNPNIIDNRTVFILLRSNNQLHFLHSVPQLAALRKGNHPIINKKDEIYNHLYLGFYLKDEHTIYYRSFANTPVIKISFSHKTVKDNQTNQPLNTAVISLKYRSKEPKEFPIDNWVYSAKKLKESQLVEANEDTKL